MRLPPQLNLLSRGEDPCEAVTPAQSSLEDSPSLGCLPTTPRSTKSPQNLNLSPTTQVNSYAMSQTTSTSTTGGIADKVSQAASYVTETAKEMGSGMQKEADKSTMKDSNAPLADRAGAGLSAAQHKVEESGHSTKADAHKEMVKH